VIYHLFLRCVLRDVVSRKRDPVDAKTTWPRPAVQDGFMIKQRISDLSLVSQMCTEGCSE